MEILSWSDTAIRVLPSGTLINSAAPWDWGAMCTTLQVTAANNLSATKGMTIAPALVNVRPCGQCTFHVARRRWSMGLTPSPGAYSGYADITTSWVPQRGDQLQWAIGHTAIIEQTSGPTTASDGTKTYAVRISQMNAACNNEYSELWTTFRVRGMTVLETPRFRDGGPQAVLKYFR
jgi:hypothetical protein